jgi:predicted nuclease of predicted toxin-antitoxin system
MRILANENFPGPVVQALRARAEDVAWVAEDMRAANDEAVLARAQTEGRIVVTLDKDFGELAFKAGLPATCGIVLFRLTGRSPEEDNARAMAALAEPREWAGHFAVVQDDRIRIRPLPGVQEGA